MFVIGVMLNWSTKAQPQHAGLPGLSCNVPKRHFSPFILHLEISNIWCRNQNACHCACYTVTTVSILKFWTFSFFLFSIECLVIRKTVAQWMIKVLDLRSRGRCLKSHQRLRHCCVLNPYKPSVLFVGHRQTVQTQSSRRRTRRLIMVSNVCLQNIRWTFE